MQRVRAQIHTRVGAVLRALGEAAAIGRLAPVGGAALALAADRAAGAAVCGVRRQIHAGAATVGKSRQAGAVTVGTCLTGRARIPAGAAMCGIVHGVDTAAVAVLRSVPADAVAGRAGLESGVARSAALTAVRHALLQVDARAVAHRRLAAGADTGTSLAGRRGRISAVGGREALHALLRSGVAQRGRRQTPAADATVDRPPIRARAVACGAARSATAGACSRAAAGACSRAAPSGCGACDSRSAALCPGARAAGGRCKLCAAAAGDGQCQVGAPRRPCAPGGVP